MSNYTFHGRKFSVDADTISLNGSLSGVFASGKSTVAVSSPTGWTVSPTSCDIEYIKVGNHVWLKGQFTDGTVATAGIQTADVPLPVNAASTYVGNVGTAALASTGTGHGGVAMTTIGVVTTLQVTYLAGTTAETGPLNHVFYAMYESA